MDLHSEHNIVVCWVLGNFNLWGEHLPLPKPFG